MSEKIIPNNKKLGKCPVCKTKGIEYSKNLGYYCGCQGLGGQNEFDEEWGY